MNFLTDEQNTWRETVDRFMVRAVAPHRQH